MCFVVVAQNQTSLIVTSFQLSIHAEMIHSTALPTLSTSYLQMIGEIVIIVEVTSGPVLLIFTFGQAQVRQHLREPEQNAYHSGSSQKYFKGKLEIKVI